VYSRLYEGSSALSGTESMGPRILELLKTYQSLITRSYFLAYCNKIFYTIVYELKLLDSRKKLMVPKYDGKKVLADRKIFVVIFEEAYCRL
jgi:hypothetical protein